MLSEGQVQPASDLTAEEQATVVNIKAAMLYADLLPLKAQRCMILIE